MTRAVTLTVPEAYEDTLRTALAALPHAQRVRVVECRGANEVQVQFVCVDKHLSGVLKGVEGTGVGTAFGTIDIYALQSTIPSLVRTKEAGDKKKKYNLQERKTVREIEETIDSGCHLTFDYIVLTVVASMLSTVGLLSDSEVTVVASMLVSPLMGPILAVAYGTAVGQPGWIRLGLKNELWGLLICFGVGTLAGLVAVGFFSPLAPDRLAALTGGAPLQSNEVESRGRAVALFSGFCTAVASGIGVSIATTNATVSALVGVAISSALLPPLVNAAVCITMGAVYSTNELTQGEFAAHYLGIGIVSFSLFVVNFFTIWFFSVLTFWVKGVSGHYREFSERMRHPLRSLGIHLSHHRPHGGGSKERQVGVARRADLEAGFDDGGSAEGDWDQDAMSLGPIAIERSRGPV